MNGVEMRRPVFLGAWLASIVFANFALASEPVPLNDRAKRMDAEYALVFIHGILGSGGSSESPGSFGRWPEIISEDQTDLPDHGKISDIAVYAMDYSESFTTTAGLDQIAIGVADDLSGSKVFEKHRHVWIVAHSMGGIVLKRVLTRWHSQGKDLLIGRILGVGMMGVPAAGSPVADLVKNYGVDQIAKHFGWNGSLLNDLVTTNSGSYLNSVDEDWRTLRGIRDDLQRNSPPPFTTLVSCGYETKNEIDRTLWTGLAAWALSARLGGWARSMIGLGGDIDTIDIVVPKLYSENTWCDSSRGLPYKHTELPSPLKQGDDQHLWLRKLFNDSINRNMNWNFVSFGSGPAPQSIADQTAHSVAHIVAEFNDDLHSGNTDPKTHLPRNPEEITFADAQSAERAKSLVLTGGQFEKSTLTYAWLEAKKMNQCLVVVPSENRMSIEISVTDELRRCVDSAFVCQANSCD